MGAGSARRWPTDPYVPDSGIMGFACEEDARRVLEVLPKRFGRYGLTLHPDKTRLVPFRKPSRASATDSRAAPRPGTFDLLDVWFEQEVKPRLRGQAF